MEDVRGKMARASSSQKDTHINTQNLISLIINQWCRDISIMCILMSPFLYNMEEITSRVAEYDFCIICSFWGIWWMNKMDVEGK